MSAILYDSAGLYQVAVIGNVSDTGKELYENDSAGCYGRRRRPELQILVTENES